MLDGMERTVTKTSYSVIDKEDDKGDNVLRITHSIELIFEFWRFCLTVEHRIWLIAGVKGGGCNGINGLST